MATQLYNLVKLYEDGNTSTQQYEQVVMNAVNGMVLFMTTMMMFSMMLRFMTANNTVGGMHE